jgi:aspartate dehydrogenase
MNIGMIGRGAIARYVTSALAERGQTVDVVLLRADRIPPDATVEVGSVAEIPPDIDVMIDCAGHAALVDHGPIILARGIDLITVSLGALADVNTEKALAQAAQDGGSKLHLASGAIGALDCLNAARIGGLTSVVYTGRKPPKGWRGSPAEAKLNLDALDAGSETHFEGSARDAAKEYPKNANVAAAVALAGLGFDDTQVRLIADASIEQNIHEVSASGPFGQFQFEISGNALPDNPRSSALAAMSVLSKLDQLTREISL